MIPEEQPLAARAIVSGMADTPIHAAVHREPDRDAHLRGLEFGFGAIPHVTERPALVAFEDGERSWGPPLGDRQVPVPSRKSERRR